MKFNFVTGNIGKFEEVKELLGKRGIAVEHINISKPEIDSNDVKEVAEYAAKKLANKLNKTVVVEDTGFYLAAYKNFPGTNSKSVFNGIGFDGFMRLLDGKTREAAFRIIVSYCKPGKKPVSFEGEIDGTITKDVIKGGYESLPYDQIFIPEGYEKTFSQDMELKNKISHRVTAFGKLADYLEKIK